MQDTSELRKSLVVLENKTSNTDFPPLLNTNILNAARGYPVKRIPVWAHRQAGRYLPEYKETRAKAKDFFNLCQTPTMACEVTLQPLRRFDLDAAIIFCDILVVPQALGMEVQMVPGKGPSFPSPLKTPEDMKLLKTIDNIDLKSSLKYLFDAITLTRHSLKGVVPLLGFSGGPWTLFAYMIEGSGAKTYSAAKAWLYKYPNESHKLLQLLTDVIVEYLLMQIEAGAQMVEVFDSWAGDLSSSAFKTFGLPYLSQIASRVQKAQSDKNTEPVPMTVFARGVCEHLNLLATETSFDVVSVDWVVSPEYAVEQLKNNNVRSVTIQGNLDMSVLYASEEIIRKEVSIMCNKFGNNCYIANLGHGMLPSHDPEALGIFIDQVHQHPC